MKYTVFILFFYCLLNNYFVNAQQQCYTLSNTSCKKSSECRLINIVKNNKKRWVCRRISSSPTTAPNETTDAPTNAPTSKCFLIKSESACRKREDCIYEKRVRNGRTSFLCRKKSTNSPTTSECECSCDNAN
jgi:hypothetical protein